MRLKKQGQMQRAIEAYTRLVAAEEWLTGTLQGYVESFGLTMSRFRVIVALARNGPMVQGVLIAQTLRGGFSNGALVLRNLERDGLVKHAPHNKDRRMIVYQLTGAGKELLAEVYPEYGKVVRAHMAALLSREQELLARLCEKLRAGNLLRFVHEWRAAEEENEG